MDNTLLCTFNKHSKGSFFSTTENYDELKSNNHLAHKIISCNKHRWKIKHTFRPTKLFFEYKIPISLDITDLNEGDQVLTIINSNGVIEKYSKLSHKQLISEFDKKAEVKSEKLDSLIKTWL